MISNQLFKSHLFQNQINPRYAEEKGERVWGSELRCYGRDNSQQEQSQSQGQGTSFSQAVEKRFPTWSTRSYPKKSANPWLPALHQGETF